jgi:dihydrofolate synthase/folylpolyglutamate synthase
MNYREAVAAHEAAKQYGSLLGLDAIRNLMHELGDVWQELKIVHIAGTNGKGSVGCFLATTLREAGYRVGQFNSPAVFEPLEMYQVNGRNMEPEAFALCMEQVEAACGRLVRRGQSHPTVFEMETAIAFLWFYKEKCDVVLLEAGMGGGTDATNLIQKPLCSVLTSVGLDHMEYLGDSLEKIAEVKSGIIKEHTPVVTVPQPPEVEQVFRKRAKERHASYIQAPGIDAYEWKQNRLCYKHPLLGDIRLSMLGSCQVENSALAAEVLLLLGKLGYPVSAEQIRRGLEQSRWPGRLECLSTSPLFYIDGAHNVAAAEMLKDNLIKCFPHQKKVGIMGVMADKQYGRMLDCLLPFFERIYTVTPENPRALPASALAGEISGRGGCAIPEERVEDAVYHAVEWAEGLGEPALVLAFGSLYYLGQVKGIFYEMAEHRTILKP